MIQRGSVFKTCCLQSKNHRLAYLFPQLHAHTHSNRSHQSLPCPMQSAGLSSDDFSVCLFGLFESHENEMLTFRIISILTCICSTFLIFNVFWGAWAAGRVIIIYAVLMLATWGQHLLTQAAHSVLAFFLPWGECDWMNELLPCRHGLLERKCSFQVKTVWSACCASGPFNIFEFTPRLETVTTEWWYKEDI